MNRSFSWAPVQAWEGQTAVQIAAAHGHAEAAAAIEAKVRQQQQQHCDRVMVRCTLSAAHVCMCHGVSWCVVVLQVASASGSTTPVVSAAE